MAGCAAPAQAAPISYDIGSCLSGDSGNFPLPVAGSILAKHEVVNSNDLLITLTNALESRGPLFSQEVAMVGGTGTDGRGNAAVLTGTTRRVAEPTTLPAPACRLGAAGLRQLRGTDVSA